MPSILLSDSHAFLIKPKFINLFVLLPTILTALSLLSTLCLHGSVPVLSFQITILKTYQLRATYKALLNLCNMSTIHT